MGKVIEMKNIFSNDIIYISSEYSIVTVHDLYGYSIARYEYSINFVIFLYVLKGYNVINGDVSRI